MVYLRLETFILLVITLRFLLGVPIGGRREMVAGSISIETMPLEGRDNVDEVSLTKSEVAGTSKIYGSSSTAAITNLSPSSSDSVAKSSYTTGFSSQDASTSYEKTSSITSDTLSASGSPSTSESSSVSESPSASESSIPSDSSSNSTDLISKNDYHKTTEKIWNRFWVLDNNQWNDNDAICDDVQYSEPVVWNQAVVGKAITNTGDIGRIAKVANAIAQYKNDQLGAYSATTAGNEDIYTDDNAQLAWVFTEAFKKTGNISYLESAEEIVLFLMTQWNSEGKGGVIWQYNADYIASISTVEAALASIRLYEITLDSKLLNFTEECMDFMFQYFQDTDGLFFDGLNKNDYNDVNKGKLSYTVGCALSTLAYLDSYSDHEDWKSKALSLAEAAMDQSGAFYNGNKIWNNDLKYIHLLYVGFVDLLTLTDWESEYDDFKNELFRQCSLMIEFLQDPDDLYMYFNLATESTKKVFDRYENTYKEGITFKENNATYCQNDPSKPAKKSLIDNGSAAQVLYEISRL